MRKLLLVLILSVFTACNQEKPNPEDLHQYLPENASIILRMPDPDIFFSHLGNNGFIRQNKSHPLYRFLEQRLSFFDYFSNREPALLAFSEYDKGEIHYTYIARGTLEIKPLDDIRNRTVETLKSEGMEIKKYTIEGTITYTTVLERAFIISSSLNNIKDILTNPANFPEEDQNFTQVFKASSNELPVVFINSLKTGQIFLDLFPGTDISFFEKFSDWTALDLEINPNSFKINGVTVADPGRVINIFEGVQPVENELSTITPTDAVGFNSVSFEEFSVLLENLRKFQRKNSPVPSSPELELLKTAIEAGTIYLKNNRIFVIRPVDSEAAREHFASGKEVVGEFRGTEIYSYSDKEEFPNLLRPLLSPDKLNYFLFLNNFILFSEEKGALEEAVENFQNKTTLAQNEAYLSVLKNLSSQASLLLVRNNENFRPVIARNVPDEFSKETNELSFENFPVSALQFINSDGFSHVHGVFQKEKSGISEKGVIQTAATNLDAHLASSPVFFNNHRNNGLDIAVQDVDNTLYLISDSGKIFWKKALDFRILGDVKQVDLYRNGRIQLAFATPRALHIIDRDGNPVPPFPLEFNDEITQPLAVFDYDNNRKYRFLIVQGNELLMYNSKGQLISGFGFSGTKEEIVKIPRHIRIGKKDYILVSEASGNLHILSRQGNIRVPVKGDLSPSETPWYEYRGKFLSSDAAGNLVTIDQQGNVSEEDRGISPEHHISATENTLAILSENELLINGKTVEMDYGLYTPPVIFTSGDEIYVSVTDLQSHRVLLFNDQASLISGFPVYGNSAIDMGNADGDKNQEFTVQGEKNSILVYEIRKK